MAIFFICWLVLGAVALVPLSWLLSAAHETS